MTDAFPSETLEAAASARANEEFLNSVSHAIGLIGGIVAAPILVITAVEHGDAADVVAACVFALAIVALYLSSTIYHALPPGPTKRFMQAVDHSAIFLLIAGTWTPFVLGPLRGPWGWTMFGIVWALAAGGMLLKCFGAERYPVLSTVMYLAMGWLGLIAFQPLAEQMPRAGLVLLLAGGLAYTGGVAFFVAERLRYNHLVWHLFVIGGTTCHVVAVAGFLHA